jgi:hypothetical protein
MTASPREARLSAQLLLRLISWRTILIAIVLSDALAAENPSLAQRTDSNIGLEGGHGSLIDSILATPNRKTPVPQDNIFATAPGATQMAPASQSKTTTIPTPTVRKRTFQGEQQ